MDRAIRTRTATSRLTYTAPGQQAEATGTLGIGSLQRQAMEPVASGASNQLPDMDSPEGIEYWIAFNQRLLKSAELDLLYTEQEAAMREGKDQDSMSPEEWDSWQIARSKRHNANVAIKQANDRLRDLFMKRDKLTFATIQAGVSSGTTTTTSNKVCSQRSRSRASGSFASNASTIKKRVGLEAKGQIMQLRDQLEIDLEEVESEIRKLKKQAQTDTNSQKYEEEIANLQDKKLALERTFLRKEKQIQENCDFQMESIDLEFEEEQQLADVGGQRSNLPNIIEEGENDCGVDQNQKRNPPPAKVDLIPHDWAGFGIPVPSKPAIPLKAEDAEFPHGQDHHDWSAPQNQDTFHHGNNKNSGPMPEDTGNAVLLLANTLTSALKGVHMEKDWEPRDLPIFTGKAEDWPIFKNEFNRTTPTGRINSSQNAIRLRKALKGSAREAVVGLLQEPENVVKILQILEQRFGRKELVIDALIEKAEQCKSPDAQKPESFVVFGTTVQHLIATVEALREESYLNDRGLLNKLVSKLSVTYSADWIKWISARPDLTENLASFGTWLDEQISVLVRLYKPTIKDNDGTGPNRKPTRGSVKVNAVTTEKPPAEPAKQCCTFCEKDNHQIWKCFKFKDKPVEERLKHVKDKGLCFRCLGSGHAKRDCTTNVSCNQKDCQLLHHPLLHTERKFWKKGNKSGAQKKERISDDEGQEKKQSSSEAMSNIGATTLHQSKPISIVRVRVKGPKGIKRVYALLDSGCDTTVILSNLAKELGIHGKQIKNQCHVVGGKSFGVVSNEVEFQVAGAYKTAKFYPIKDALTMDNVGLSAYSQDANEVKQRWSYLRKAKLDSFTGVKVDLIIGEDHPYVTAHRELLQRQPDEPMAKRTLLGWVLAGKVNSLKGSINVNAISFEGDGNLDELLKASFGLDSYGVYPKDTLGSLEDRRALEILNSTVRKVSDTQWECGLLWKDKHVKLPPSREEAVSRLLRNEKRMRNDPAYSEMYHQKIEEYLSKGYIRELTAEELRARNDRTLYIPHFGVYNINKPGKLRLVFDAACRGGGVSLNQYLLTGPDLIRPLPTVLMNFRIHNIVLTGDMEDMYHRVNVILQDRDSQRFVWRSLKDKNKRIRDYVANVLLFGSCSSQSSAIFVKDENAEEFIDQYPEAVRAIKEDFYSDDCLSGAQTVEDAIILRRQIKEINAAGNFAVKKWLSNRKEVLYSIPEDDRATGKKSFSDKSEIPAGRVLGLWWKPEEDVFTFSANYKKIDPTLLEGRRPTKREMCRLLMSVFDPLGFIANFRIKGLILLQQTWRTDVNWDEEITDSIYKEWKEWVKTLKNTENVFVPRSFVKDIHLASDIQLHTLVDASEEATTAICYLRITVGESVSVSFVCAKSKVAPIKKQTIPRLELIAAVMGACLADKVVNELRLQIRGRYFWTDSRTVLMWIRTESLRYKEFVANRVNRIHLLSQVREWKWIPTELNVADQGTRLRSKIELTADSLWLRGPKFLLEAPEKWPVEDKETEIFGDDMEVRKTVIFAAQVLGDAHGVTASVYEKRRLKGGTQEATVCMQRFSSFNRMVRAQCAVICAARYWLSKIRGVPEKKPWNKEGKMKASVFAPEDIKQAELMLVRKAQSDAFGEDLDHLIKKGQLPKGSKLWRFSVFLDNGILRVDGRIGAAQVAEMTKTPMLLPAKHHFTTLLVMKEHNDMAHQGHETVLSNLRKRFWILEGRAVVRRVAFNCLFCKFRKAKPVTPKMGELPYYRVAACTPPFTHTGVDLMGPVEVVVGRHHEKRWIIVFTCMVTRAVHLDVVYGLSTDETLMALSRFVDQRGRPRHVYSDNGTNFVGAKRELKRNWDAVDWSKIVNMEKFQQIKWQFSPPCSPHFGGAWERMVQLVKRILKTTLAEKFPRDQTLLTMIKGAENIINSRPITAVSSDPTDPEALTPNHFLRGFADVGPAIPGEYEQADEMRRAHWRRSQRFAHEFWNRWIKEALPELLRREKWYTNVEPLAVGDIVLLVDDQAPRNAWKKGVVTTTLPGRDGQVRVVQVETAAVGKKDRVTYKRGVDKLVPLGIRMENQGKHPDFGGRNVVA